jgi:hypothetical protein
MKRIALAVAVASLLVSPAVLADSAPASILQPSEGAPDGFYPDASSYQLLLRGIATVPTASFEDPSSAAPKPLTASPVTGSFEDASSTDPHPAPASRVTASFEDAYSGD